MSLTPAAAKTSASPTFAQQMPKAPRSICIFATTGDLCVFACGRRRVPALDASCCTRSMLLARRERSMTTCGVGRSESLATLRALLLGSGQLVRVAARVAGELGRKVSARFVVMTRLGEIAGFQVRDEQVVLGVVVHLQNAFAKRP